MFRIVRFSGATQSGLGGEGESDNSKHLNTVPVLWFHLMPYTELPEDFQAKRPDPHPFAWNGRFHKLRYVNVWPRPVQRPAT